MLSDQSGLTSVNAAPLIRRAVAPIPSLARLSRGVQRSGGRLGLLVAVAIALPFGRGAVAAAPPLDVAVGQARGAATAVLERAGAETCLRGKLTRALLGLSNSCEASGTRNALCSLADKAVVVTPMSLTFMDDTSRQLLELINPGGSAQRAPVRPGDEPAAEMSVVP